LFNVFDIAERRFMKHKPGTMTGQEVRLAFPIMERERDLSCERPGEPEGQELDYRPSVGLRDEVRGGFGAGRLGPVLA
jgi:hypothetical protein